MDVLTPEQRKYNMSRIRGRDTRPEIRLRKWIWKDGYRYRLHVKDLPGKPDIVLPKFRTVIQVHGCFWHRHSCKAASSPATNRHFWTHKFAMNVERDRRNLQNLQRMGWRVITVWECALKKSGAERSVVMKIRKFLDSPRRKAIQIE